MPMSKAKKTVLTSILLFVTVCRVAPTVGFMTQNFSNASNPTQLSYCASEESQEEDKTRSVEWNSIDDDEEDDDDEEVPIMVIKKGVKRRCGELHK